MLNPGVEAYIKINLKTDILSVLLKKSPFPEISSQELAQQLKGRQISQKKFPTYFNTPGILYPKKVHLEQASSEETAIYKSRLVSGKTLLDLTAGMGIDSFFFAARFDRVICCEKDDELGQITKHNMRQLALDHVEIIQGDGLDVLRTASYPIDCIYIDPSRRSAGKKNVQLEDYEPDLLAVLELLLEKCKILLIKTSPMLDIDLGIKQLQYAAECHIVAVRNEVKELVWLLKPGFIGETRLMAVNIDISGESIFEFTRSEEGETSVNYHTPLTYLYEPNAALLKSGGFKCVADRFKLKKLGASSHLYTSDAKIDFPGRRFRIIELQEFSRNWNKKIRIGKANITTRNFGLTVAEIRKRFKVSEGGDDYLFFTTLSDGKKVVIKCIKD